MIMMTEEEQKQREIQKAAADKFKEKWEQTYSLKIVSQDHWEDLQMCISSYLGQLDRGTDYEIHSVSGRNIVKALVDMRVAEEGYTETRSGGFGGIIGGATPTDADTSGVAVIIGFNSEKMVEYYAGEAYNYTEEFIDDMNMIKLRHKKFVI